MPPTGTIIKTGKIYLVQPYYRPSFTAEIIRSDGTVDEISSDCLSASITKVVNTGVDYFSIILSNSAGKNTGLWSGGERCDIWLDYVTAKPVTSHYRFNDNVEDFGSYNYDGTSTGVTYVSGKLLNCGNFTGSSSSQIVLNDSNLMITNNSKWSIALWFNADTISAGSADNHLITFHRGSGTGIAVSLCVGSTNQVQLYYHNGSTTSTINIDTVLTSTWYHLVLTYDGSAYKTYLNGVLKTTITDTFSGMGSQDARIGTFDNTNNMFDGKIDDVRIYDSCILKWTECLAIYNNGKGTEETRGRKQFRGTLEYVFHSLNSSGRIMSLIGRGGGLELLEVHASKTYSNIDVSDAVDDLIDTYATNVTYTPSGVGTTIEIDFDERPVWNCLQDVFEQAQHDFYVDSNLVLQNFAKNSQVNIQESVVIGMNLKDINIGTDIREVKNRIRNYGGSAESSSDVIVLQTAEDSSSQILHGIREMINTNTQLKSTDAVSLEASTLLASSPSQQGDFSTLGLPSLLPGQKIRISDPYENVIGYYRILELTHDWSVANGFITRGTIEKQIKRTEDKLKELYKFKEQTRIIKNPNGMKYSFIVKFDGTENLTLTNTTISESSLILSSGQNSGQCIVATHNAPMDIVQCELRIMAQDLENSIIYVSNDGGTNEKTISANSSITFITTGSSLRIRLVLNTDSTNPNPKIDTLGILYK